MSGVRTGPIARERLRRAGRRGPDAFDWALRAGATLLALSAAWLGFALLRPLPEPAAVMPHSFPVVPRVEREAPPIAARRELLATLSADNLFDAERIHWSGVSAAASAEDGPGGAAGAASPEPAPGERARIGEVSVTLTPREAIPDDVRTALTGLRLRGVYRPPPRGAEPVEPVAMISCVHEGPNPLLSRPYRAGDVVKDPRYPQADWRVLAVDPARLRVILSRSNTNVALELYPMAGPGSPRAGSAEEVAPAAPRIVVVERTKDEVAAELREAGLPEDQIARLLELVEMTPEQAAASAALSAVVARPPAGEGGDQPARRSPPPGLEAVVRMMQSIQKTGGEGIDDASFPGAAPPVRDEDEDEPAPE